MKKPHSTYPLRLPVSVKGRLNGARKRTASASIGSWLPRWRKSLLP